MNITAPEWRLNASLSKGRALLQKCEAEFGPNFALFANQVGGGSSGNFFIPDSKTQNNLSAPWVDTNQDLSAQDPNVSVYLVIWNDQKEHYADVAGILQMLKYGVPLASAI